MKIALKLVAAAAAGLVSYSATATVVSYDSTGALGPLIVHTIEGYEGSYESLCLSPDLPFSYAGMATIERFTSPVLAVGVARVANAYGWSSANWATDGVTTLAQAYEFQRVMWNLGQVWDELGVAEFKPDYGRFTFGVADGARISAMIGGASTFGASTFAYMDPTKDDQLRLVSDLVQAVPEPSTLASLLAGLACLGFAARPKTTAKA